MKKSILRTACAAVIAALLCVTCDDNAITGESGRAAAFNSMFGGTPPDNATRYTLTTAVSGSGSVYPGTGSYPEGTTVNVTATAGPDHMFSRWEGDAEGNNMTASVLMNRHKAVTAVFVEKPATPTVYTLTTRVSPPNGGNVNPQTGNHSAGDIVSLTATAAEGFMFSYWIDDASGTNPTASVAMNGNKTVTAVFIEKPATTTYYTLTTRVSPPNGGNVTPATGRHQAGAEISVTANPAGGFTFSGWQDDAAGTGQTVSVLMNGDKTVTAMFVATPVDPCAANTNAAGCTPLTDKYCRWNNDPGTCWQIGGPNAEEGNKTAEACKYNYGEVVSDCNVLSDLQYCYWGEVGGCYAMTNPDDPDPFVDPPGSMTYLQNCQANGFLSSSPDCADRPAVNMYCRWPNGCFWMPHPDHPDPDNPPMTYFETCAAYGFVSQYSDCRDAQ